MKTKRYVVAVRCKDGNEIFDFKSKKNRDAFINDLPKDMEWAKSDREEKCRWDDVFNITDEDIDAIISDIKRLSVDDPNDKRQSRKTSLGL